MQEDCILLINRIISGLICGHREKEDLGSAIAPLNWGYFKAKKWFGICTGEHVATVGNALIKHIFFSWDCAALQLKQLR